MQVPRRAHKPRLLHDTCGDVGDVEQGTGRPSGQLQGLWAHPSVPAHHHHQLGRRMASCGKGGRVLRDRSRPLRSFMSLIDLAVPYAGCALHGKGLHLAPPVPHCHTGCAGWIARSGHCGHAGASVLGMIICGLTLQDKRRGKQLPQPSRVAWSRLPRLRSRLVHVFAIVTKRRSIVALLVRPMCTARTLVHNSIMHHDISACGPMDVRHCVARFCLMQNTILWGND